MTCQTGMRWSSLALLLAMHAAAAEPKLVHFDPASLDRTRDPCTDFYAYACTKWQAANPIPKDQAAWHTGSNLHIYSEEILRRAMERAAAPRKDRSPVEQRIGDYYAACMDEAGLARQGLAPIRADLARIAALTDKAGLAREIAALHRSAPGASMGDDDETHAALFGFGSEQDFNDSSLVVAYVDQGGMGLPGRDYYLASDDRSVEIRAKYLEHVARMLSLSGVPKGEAAAGAKVVLAMETELARAAMDPVKRRDPKAIYNVRTLAEIMASAPAFDWKTYLELTAAPAPHHYVVNTPDFLVALSRLVEKEPVEHWRTYLRWWTLHGNAPYLSAAFEAESFDFYGRTLTGAMQLMPRWRRCVEWADRDLGEALGPAYVARAFPDSSRGRVVEMVTAIRQALANDIEGLDWMEPSTKAEAEEKLRAVENKIGYPTAWRDYSSVSIGRVSLAANVHAATAFEFSRQLAKVGQPVDRGEWQMTPPTLNAYYDQQLNTINFPAGILQPPYFEAALDDAVNYGAIGTVIGHEITHGFDDQGRKFDSKGNLRDWWTSTDAEKYEARGKCIADEYTGDIPELGVKRNGLLTQGEDTADNGGLRLAYRAFRATKEGQAKEVSGTDGLTPSQRFFAAYAFSWCENVRPQRARLQVTTNPHSLAKFRVDDVVANMPEFQSAFACKPGAPMVHENACRVW
jgi:putative endopeptidase